MELNKLVNKLIDNDLTISTIESLTGGGFAYFFTKVPGASATFKKGLVTYSNEAKIDAGVDKDILKQYGAVSNEVALEMLNTLYETDVAISFTGNAGPDAMDDKPVGRVYIGIRIKNDIWIEEYNFTGSRDEIRLQSIEKASNFILEKI